MLTFPHKGQGRSGPDILTLTLVHPGPRGPIIISIHYLTKTTMTRTIATINYMIDVKWPVPRWQRNKEWLPFFLLMWSTVRKCIERIDNSVCWKDESCFVNITQLQWTDKFLLYCNDQLLQLGDAASCHQCLQTLRQCSICNATNKKRSFSSEEEPCINSFNKVAKADSQNTSYQNILAGFGEMCQKLRTIERRKTDVSHLPTM